MLEALLKKKNQDGRFRYLYWIIIVIFIILVSRLVYLQLFAGEYYHTLAEGNRLRAIPIAAMRGIMYDRNGQILVGSRPSFMVTYVPPKEGMSDEELQKLAGILNMPEDKLREKVQKVKSSYVPTVLANDLTQDIVTKIEEQRNDLPGVSVDVQPIRYYPYKMMAAQVFGYVGQIDEEDAKRLKGVEGVSNITQIGRAGLEAYYDDLLRGKDGGRQVEVDAAGSPVKEMERKEPVAGHNMHLTIDLYLQQATERAMDRQIANGIGTHGIAAVAVDPNTGAVLAMASRPAYDPNWFTRGITEKEWSLINDNPNHPMENRVIAGEYPPGSTFKLITGSAALELKKVTPDEMIFDSGRHWAGSTSSKPWPSPITYTSTKWAAASASTNWQNTPACSAWARKRASPCAAKHRAWSPVRNIRRRISTMNGTSAIRSTRLSARASSWSRRSRQR